MLVNKITILGLVRCHYQKYVPTNVSTFNWSPVPPWRSFIKKGHTFEEHVFILNGINVRFFITSSYVHPVEFWCGRNFFTPKKARGDHWEVVIPLNNEQWWVCQTRVRTMDEGKDGQVQGWTRAGGKRTLAAVLLPSTLWLLALCLCCSCCCPSCSSCREMGNDGGRTYCCTWDWLT